MKYQDMMNAGYFKIENQSFFGQENRRSSDKDIIPQRKRLNVMGAIHHQIDNRNFMTTIAIVDKYGQKKFNKESVSSFLQDNQR